MHFLPRLVGAVLVGVMQFLLAPERVVLVFDHHRLSGRIRGRHGLLGRAAFQIETVGLGDTRGLVGSGVDRVSGDLFDAGDITVGHVRIVDLARGVDGRRRVAVCRVGGNVIPNELQTIKRVVVVGIERPHASSIGVGDHI